MTHRYFFWIDGDEVEIYKNGTLYKFDGEKRYNFAGDIEGFWKKWQDNSAFIPEDSDVDFIFIGKDKNEIDRLKEYPESNYNWNKDGEFSFKDLKTLLQDKPLKKFCVDIGTKKYFFKKNSVGYTKIAKNSKVETIYVVGKGIKTDFISLKETPEEEIEMPQEITGEMSSFVKFFENKMKEYKS